MYTRRCQLRRCQLSGHCGCSSARASGYGVERFRFRAGVHIPLSPQSLPHKVAADDTTPGGWSILEAARRLLGRGGGNEGAAGRPVCGWLSPERSDQLGRLQVGEYPHLARR
eukprot:351151-Chlamydomonas_euryale.AAC.2